MHLSIRTPRSFVALFVLSLALASIPVVWPQLDLAVARYFLDAQAVAHPAPPYWVDVVNEYTPDVFRGVFWLCLALLVTFWFVPRMRPYRLAVAFVALSLALGPGLMTWTAKEITLRARPIDVVEFGGQRQFTPAFARANQCTDNCAFASGHVGCGFFFAGLMLLDPRRRRFWIVIGALAGGLIGFARVSVGAHWLSDVLWPFPIALAGSWLVWSVLYRVSAASSDFSITQKQRQGN